MYSESTNLEVYTTPYFLLEFSLYQCSTKFSTDKYSPTPLGQIIKLLLQFVLFFRDIRCHMKRPCYYGFLYYSSSFFPPTDVYARYLAGLQYCLFVYWSSASSPLGVAASPALKIIALVNLKRSRIWKINRVNLESILPSATLSSDGTAMVSLV